MLPSFPSLDIGFLQPSNLTLSCFFPLILSVCVCDRMLVFLHALVCTCYGVSARKRGPVTAGKLITLCQNRTWYTTMSQKWACEGKWWLHESCLPAVDLLWGGISHMCGHRYRVCGPHIHHRHVFLCVPMLWELRWGDAPETKKERGLSERFLHCLARHYFHLHHVSRYDLPFSHDHLVCCLISFY